MQFYEYFKPLENLHQHNTRQVTLAISSALVFVQTNMVNDQSNLLDRRFGTRYQKKLKRLNFH